jgi:formyl-CoA transferase
VLENFRPGTLERLGLGPDELRAVRPDVVLVRISGYGQTGPYRDHPGFASVAEAIGGIRALTGEPDRPPVRSGVSLGDTLAGLYATIGALLALLQRERSTDGSGPETVDVALYEAVFSVLEDLVPEHDGYGVVRRRSGASLPGIVPSSTYPCRDGTWVVVGGNGDAIYRRLMAAVGRPDLADDPVLADNAGRVAQRERIDAAISAWTADRTPAQVAAELEAVSVPVGPIYAASDILGDPHYAARGMLVRHEVDVAPGDRREVAFPGVVPKLEARPGSTRGVGPDLGEHTTRCSRSCSGSTRPSASTCGTSARSDGATRPGTRSRRAIDRHEHLAAGVDQAGVLAVHRQLAEDAVEAREVGEVHRPVQGADRAADLQAPLQARIGVAPVHELRDFPAKPMASAMCPPATTAVLVNRS